MSLMKRRHLVDKFKVQASWYLPPMLFSLVASRPVPERVFCLFIYFHVWRASTLECSTLAVYPLLIPVVVLILLLCVLCFFCPFYGISRSPIPDSVKICLEEGINLYRLHTNRHGRLVHYRYDEYLSFLLLIMSQLHLLQIF